MIKKMSDVFELPLKRSFNGLIVGANNSPVSNFWGRRREDYAAHAINHVDALADALLACSELIESLGLQSFGAYQSAISALNAYRGEK